MAKTVEEIEKLKADWYADPCWDLYQTEGFEEHEEELKTYQHQSEIKWKIRIQNEDKELDREAEQLGINGLYRLLLRYEKIQDNHAKAIEALTYGRSKLAYRILHGYKE
jgi:hypothetical protein